MIWYWMILGIKKIIWFLRLPKLEAIAIADKNERCPVCGWRNGSMRCVLKAKEAVRNPKVIQEHIIVRQHTCNECGAGWFHKPLLKDVTPSTVVPSVARTELESKQDRRSLLHPEETSPTT